MIRWIFLLLSLFAIAATRLWNFRQIVVDQQIYFVDADCYSRMTRVAAVLAKPGTILRHHNFENWPIGTTPHTTAPLDYLIAAVALVTGRVDWAGAITPVLLALASGIVLWRWVGSFRWITQLAVMTLFAVSPILVHGTVLGRPDHQVLLIFLLLVALTTEWDLQKIAPTKTTAIINGVAWGLGAWTSLFEPILLLFASIALGLSIWTRQWWTPARKISLVSLGICLLAALAVERWHIGPLPQGPIFEKWAKSIGELAPVGWIAGTYLSWFGFTILLVAGCLAWLGFYEKNRAALFWGLLLLGTFALTASAARWGYFLGIALILALPIVLEKWRNPWLGVAFFLGLWPVAADWDARIWPNREETARIAEQTEDYRQLREICQKIDDGGVIAPWWMSPAIAYWTDANAVAGSSHQSLPGIVDVAKFYLSNSEWGSILQRRDVKWVIAYEPERIISTSAALIGNPSEIGIANRLYTNPGSFPGVLQMEAATTFFKLYRVIKTEKISDATRVQ